MKPLCFEAGTGRQLDEDTTRGGAMGFISWARFAGVLRQAGEIRHFESALYFRVDERGIHFATKFIKQESNHGTSVSARE
jgi:hypothetical protein